MIKILEELCRIPAAPGMEKGIFDYITEKHAKDVEFSFDGMGNLTVTKKCGKENAKKIMLCTGVDTDGFIVNYIQDNGYLRVTKLGNPSIVSCAYTELVSDKGVYGFIVPEKGAEVKEGDTSGMYVDIGAASREEAEKLVKCGDVLSTIPTFTELCGKRAGGCGASSRALTAILLKIMSEKECGNADIYFTFTVQNSLFHRGAKTAAFDVPFDLCISLDACESLDTIGAVKRGEACLSDGAVIMAKTKDYCISQELKKKITDIAEKIGVKNKICVYPEKTTASSMLSVCRDGNICAELCIPVRNAGSGAEIFDVTDAENLYQLICAVISEN